MKNYKKISLFTLLFILLLNIGFASWVIVNGSNVFDNNQIAEKENSIPVAYTYANNVKTQFTSIESALKHTDSGTVYVIPGANPIITSDCTIKANVTLCIPFDDDGQGGHTDYTNRENQGGASFADTNESGVTKYRKSLVTIANGVELTNNGTLEIGGKLGTGKSNQRPTGHTYGDYAELLMKDNSVINNNGQINLYGYIKESSTNNGSKIIYSSGSNIKMPFVIYDFRGGAYSIACYNYSDKIMPFSNYDMPNCQVLQQFNYGAKINGMLTLYMKDSFSKSEPLILGTNSDDCLFKLSNGFVTLKYTPNNCLYTVNDVTSTVDISKANFSYITVNGDISLASIKMSMTIVTTININSADMYCPLDFKYHIEVQSGTLNIANKMKFLSGSSLTIDEGATVNINASTTFYQGYVPEITYAAKNLYPANVGAAKLINNGTLNLNSSFGGFIDLTQTTGKIITGSNFSSLVTTTEALESKNSSSFLGALSAKVSSADDHNENAEALVSYNGLQSSKRLLIKEKQYDAAKKSTYCWATLVNTNIAINATGTTNLSDNADGSQKVTISASLLPEESMFDLSTISWTYKADKNSGKAQSLTWTGLDATFTITNTNYNGWTAWKREWTYIITCSITGTDGKTYASNSITITVTK